MLVVGSVAFDTLHTPTGSFSKTLGGSAFYAALAGSLFTKVQLVGIVGKDYPESALAMLRDRVIDTAGVEIVHGDTFHWEGKYSPDLTTRKSLRTDLNVFADFHPKVPISFRATPFVMLGNIHPDLQVEVLEQIQHPKFVVADTMNYWISGTPAQLARMLKRIDLLVINEEEARQLSETYNIVKAARILQGMGPTRVVIKRGEYGAILFEDDEIFMASAYPVEDVLDPTGAGDVFAGGLLGSLAANDDVTNSALRRAVIYGSAIASFCVEGIGPQRLLELTFPEVRARYERFRELAHFVPAEGIE